MVRAFSFAVLVVIILLMGALLVWVLSQFLVPMFLAMLLVVLFGPFHEWVRQKCRGRDAVAAGLTTLSILVVLLLPLTWIMFRGVSEGVSLAKNLHPDDMLAQVKQLDNRLTPMWERFGIESPLDEKAIVDTISQAVSDHFGSAAAGGLKFVAKIVVGLAIMTVSLYFFLLDGPAMLDTVTRLAPLEIKHQRQLLTHFGDVCRAVVMASLLSALVQGLLAGAGFWLAGIPPAVLLMFMTMLLALVPFVGAAAVWIPCCLWLGLAEGRITAAILLAIYGTFVISLADNIIKPLVLAGTSKLHPLLALLSVLGGVQVLGPIGILVGPMLVSFLHALLVMLRSELEELGKERAAAGSESG